MFVFIVACVITGLVLLLPISDYIDQYKTHKRGEKHLNDYM